MRIDNSPAFARFRVVELGSLDTEPGDKDLVGATIVPWTHMSQSPEIFAEVEIRGILIEGSAEINWISGDATIEVIDPPRFAGDPESLISAAQPVATPAGVNGGRANEIVFDTPAGWPPLIWASETLYSAVRGWKGPQLAVEIILCALTVAPPEPALQATLLAALRAQYATVRRDQDVYPPSRYPWSRKQIPGPELRDVLAL